MLRERAIVMAKVSTVTVLTGGALLASGLTLLLLKPSTPSKQARLSGVRLSAHALPNRALVSIGGSW